MKKNGFTLIELLAVIIILGVLMIIAVPAVTKYINGSKKSSYVNTIKQVANSVRNMLYTDDYKMYDKSTTYYIPFSCVKMEDGGVARSPYGEFSKAYIVVTFTGDNYNYYFTGVDNSGMGIKNIVDLDEIEEDDIVSNVEVSDIPDDYAKDKKYVIKVLEDCNSLTSKNTGNLPVCKRAKTLHTETCTRTINSGCYAAGYRIGGSKNTTTMTYGNLGVEGTSPNSGDAFDCDVNNDGVYDSSEERFYYVTNSDNNAILIYYTNMNDQTAYAYDSQNKNQFGPRTAYQYLPSTSEWDNPHLILPGTRQITSETGELTSGGNELSEFTYTGRAARFLTTQEAYTACGVVAGNTTNGQLDRCLYFMENLGMFISDTGIYQYWLENPVSNRFDRVWGMSGDTRNINYSSKAPNYVGNRGVRPVIEISMDFLEY